MGIASIIASYIVKFGADSSEFAKELKKLETTSARTMKGLVQLSVGASAGFVGLAVAIQKTTDIFVEYQKGLVGVQKTTNLSDEEIEKLGESLVDIYKRAPVTISSLLEIAEAAGQLGISGVKDITKFTETVSQLEATTNLKGASAAETLAKILNITRENVSNVDKLGSAFVRLGNDAATNEAAIATMTLEMAKSTSIFRLGTSNLVGLSTALAAMSIQADLGSSVVARAFDAIKAAIDEGGDSMSRLSEVTGISTKDLKKAFEKDATDVFVRFLASLKDVSDEFGNTTEFLSDFGLRGTEVGKVLKPLALDVDKLQKYLRNSADEFLNTSAQSEEYKRVLETLAAQIFISNNKLQDTQRVLGKQFAPVVVAARNNIAGFIDTITKLDASNIQMIGRLGLVVAAVLGVTAAIGGTIAALGFLKIAFAGFLKTTGPIGLTITAISLLTTAFTTFFLTAPKTAKLSGEELLAVQEKANQDLLEAQKKSNDKRLDTLKDLHKQRESIITKLNTYEEEATKETLLKQLEIEKTGLELLSLQKQGAQEDTIALKQAEVSALETLSNLEKQNTAISAKSTKTAIELITKEKNTELIALEKEKLAKIREEQESSDDLVEAEIGDFEDRTLGIIEKSFEKKIKAQETALEDVDKLISDIEVPGSHPHQEDKLDKSLAKKALATKTHYDTELSKRRWFLQKMAELGVFDPSAVDAAAVPPEEEEPTTTTTTTTTTGTTPVAGGAPAEEKMLRISPIVTSLTPSAAGTALGVDRLAPTTGPSQTNEVKVLIDFTPDAINYITAKQIENEQLGIA